MGFLPPSGVPRVDSISDRRFHELLTKFGGRDVPPGSWLSQKVAALVALLRQLPDSRQRAFLDVTAVASPDGDPAVTSQESA
jgi:hypothetical protein